jgi:hypothetical protein
LSKPTSHEEYREPQHFFVQGEISLNYQSSNFAIPVFKKKKKKKDFFFFSLAVGFRRSQSGIARNSAIPGLSNEEPSAELFQGRTVRVDDRFPEEQR